MPDETNGSPDLFVSKVPQFWIDADGIGHVRVISGGTEVNFRCTPHVLLAGSSAAMRAYVEWDAGKLEPVPFDKSV